MYIEHFLSKRKQGMLWRQNSQKSQNLKVPYFVKCLEISYVVIWSWTNTIELNISNDNTNSEPTLLLLIDFNILSHLYIKTEKAD